jgi:hypothetical protein
MGPIISWLRQSPARGFSFWHNFAAMKDWLIKLFGSGDDVSSKRVIGTLGAIVLFSTMVINSFSPRDISPSKELVEAVEYITIAMFFGTAIEKFAKK